MKNADLDKCGSCEKCRSYPNVDFALIYVFCTKTQILSVHLCFAQKSQSSGGDLRFAQKGCWFTFCTDINFEIDFGRVRGGIWKSVNIKFIGNWILFSADQDRLIWSCRLKVIFKILREYQDNNSLPFGHLATLNQFLTSLLLEFEKTI